MPVPPKIKGRYEIKGTIGKGGMGMVYLAFDTVVKRDVALKTIRDVGDRKAIELFHKEYEVLAGMSHPNIVEIFDLGEFEEEGETRPFFVMSLLRGMTLDQLISTASQRLSVERSVDIITQACRGLQAAHERGLVHRDIKPNNIFVMEDDSVKLIDFGLVHRLDTVSTRGLKGTVQYMAPEQIQMKPLSPLSDIFSLGVVTYQTFVNRRPFERPNEREVFQAILHHIPPPASELNPAVNPALSRVVHKAMAKQPYSRFSSAREFAETMQKALRNEPIEIFDPVRIQPRIQRAAKAFEQGDYQFADEILTEVEAEGHIDAAISGLRRQVDQAIRQKRVLQLLESARTRLEEEEYPLALQKVEEILALDPDNLAALTLRGDIEKKRTEGKIEDWFRLARQHIDNHAYSHAREALQNVLQLKPKESQAQQLLFEVDCLEQEYLRLRREKEALYQAALEARQDGEISSALAKLERLLELDRLAPDSPAPERSAVFQNFYKQVRSEHDAIDHSYAEARRHLADRNFDKALAVCNEYLAKYQGHALFQALKFDVEEQQRQELSAFIAEVDRSVEAEPDLDKRVDILKAALDRYPGEGHFERSCRLMREKRDLVNSIVTKARLLEERSQFTEALGQWEILRTIYSQYPGLSFEIERVMKRRDLQARSEAKARWVAEIDRHLQARNYARAVALLPKAQEEFPKDAELAELEKQAVRGMERATEAFQLFSQGQELCAHRRFQEGVEVLRRAYQLDESNAMIRATLVDTLVEQASGLLDTDWGSAEALTQQALDLDPGHALAKSLRTLALDRKREEFVDQCVTRARQLQAAGSSEDALKQIEQGLFSYPNLPRLTQLQATLERELRELRHRDARRRDLDEIRRLEREAETCADANAAKSIGERLQALARLYPEDPEFQSVANEIKRRLPAVTLYPLKDAHWEPTKRMVDGQPPASNDSAIPVGERGASPPAAPPGLSTVVIRGAPPLPKPPAPSPQLGGAEGALFAAAATLRTSIRRLVARGRRTTWTLAGASVVVLMVVGGTLALFLKKSSPTSLLIPLEVRTSPPGATIRINDQVRGTSKLRLKLPPGTYHLGALMKGYRPAATTITLSPGPPASLDVTLQPLPHVVRVFTDLESGNVWLDGQRVGELQEGQFVLENAFAPGKHSLKVTGRHGEAIINFETPPEGVPVVSGPMTARELAAVVVGNLGEEAKVYCSFGAVKASLDGQPAGETGPTGLALNSLAAGTHQLVLGEGKDRREMVIETGPAPALTGFLNSDRSVGALVVVTGENGARVILNNKEYRRPTQQGQARIPNLKAGEYAVRVVKDGYQDVPEQRVQIRKGAEIKLEFKLLPVPTLASLLIQGALPGTEVVVDRSPLGTVQADGTFSASHLSPGQHGIELHKDQYKLKRITKRFVAGETVQLVGSEVTLETAMGVLQLNVSPPDSSVTLRRAGETQERPVNETTLNLPEDTYTLTARAPNYSEGTATVQVVAGSTRSADLRLSPQKASDAMQNWENPAAWKRDRNWFAQRGGNFVLFRTAPTTGRFVFTAMVRRGRRLQWVLNYRNENNYALFQMDNKFFYRSELSNGKTIQSAKVPRGMNRNGFCTLQVIITQTSIVHQLYDGKQWIPLDTWSEPGKMLANGKFGFLIPGSDEIALSNFNFYSQ